MNPRDRQLSLEKPDDATRAHIFRDRCLGGDWMNARGRPRALEKLDDATIARAPSENADTVSAI